MPSFYHMLAECEHILVDFQAFPGKDVIEECSAWRTVKSRDSGEEHCY